MPNNYSETVTYSDTNSLNYNASLVTISAGSLTLVGSPYTTTCPVITSQHQNTISALNAMSEVSTKPANTSIVYQLVLNAKPYYFNSTTSLWTLATSNTDYTQANSATVINANASTLFSQLSLLYNQFLSLNIFLCTTSTSATPVLTSTTLGYSWANSNPSTINQCTVTAYLANLIGQNPVPTPTTPIQLLVSAPTGFFHGNHFVEPFTQAFSFNASGVCTASIIETATPGVPLKFSITYWDGLSVKTSFLFNAIVPNQASINLANLSTVTPQDFG